MPNIIATVDDNIININRNNVTLMLSWGEPFNNLDPIVNYTVSCSGDVTCPPNFTTTDNTTRSYTITNLTPMTNYTFSVVATNSIGSGEAGVVMITTPSGGKLNPTYVCTYACMKVLLALGVSTDKQIRTHTHIRTHVCIHTHTNALCLLVALAKENLRNYVGACHYSFSNSILVNLLVIYLLFTLLLRNTKQHISIIF